MIKLVCIKEHPYLIVGKTYNGRIKSTLKFDYHLILERNYGANSLDNVLDDEYLYVDEYFIPSINIRFGKEYFILLADWREEQINNILYD